MITQAELITLQDARDHLYEIQDRAFFSYKSSRDAGKAIELIDRVICGDLRDRHE